MKVQVTYMDNVKTDFDAKSVEVIQNYSDICIETESATVYIPVELCKSVKITD